MVLITVYMFVASQVDPSLFTNKASSYITIILLVYVDDILINGKQPLSYYRSRPHNEIKVCNEGPWNLSYFLGIEAQQNAHGILLG